MTPELEAQLYTYLGELMHYRDNTFEWMAKESIIKKINAIYVLLGVDKREPTFSERMQEIIKSHNP